MWVVRVCPVLLLALLSLSEVSCDAIMAPPPISRARILVITNGELRQTHKTILSVLDTVCSTLNYISPYVSKIQLHSQGEYLYDAVVILAPFASLTTALPLRALRDFISAGKSVYLTAEKGASISIASIAASIGVDLSPSTLTDHVNVADELDNGSGTYIRTTMLTSSTRLFGAAANLEGAVLFHGIGATLLKDNELVRAVIRGEGTAYAGMERDMPRVAGRGSVLAAATATRVGGRLAYFGSLDALSDRALQAGGERHRVAMVSFLEWAVGMRGVLHAGRVRHQRVDQTPVADLDYRVGDRIAVEIDVMEWEGKQGTWAPFAADDMQVELTMFSPFARATFKDLGNGTFRAIVAAPYQIGVYKLVVEYRRPGLSAVEMQEVVPIRPLLHNEYERLIWMASPYYFASFGMLVSIFMMGLVMMFGSRKASLDSHEKKA